MSIVISPSANLNDILARRGANKVPAGKMRSPLYHSTVKAFAIGVPCGMLPFLDDCLAIVGGDVFTADVNDAIAKGWRYDNPEVLPKYLNVPSAAVKDFRAAISAVLNVKDERQHAALACLLAAFPAK